MTFNKHDWQVIPLELADAEDAYAWKRQENSISIQTVGSDFPLEKQTKISLGVKLWQCLDRLKPDVIAVAGYQPLPMLAALVWGHAHSRACILMSDSKVDDSPRFPIVELLKGKLLQFYQAALVAGAPHESYLRQLGFNGPIWHGYDVVNNDKFAPENIRKLPVPLSNPFFLVVSRFLPRKNLRMLLDAYYEYTKKVDSPFHLAICGDGPEKKDLKEKSIALSLENYVYFTGFLQESELLPYYAHAKALIQPSLRDQWGLVVNEAMAAGLPVLISRRLGCYIDLIRDGETGYGFDPEEPSELTHLMVRVSKSPELCHMLGESAQRAIASWSLEKFASNLLQAAINSINTNN